MLECGWMWIENAMTYYWISNHLSMGKAIESKTTHAFIPNKLITLQSIWIWSQFEHLHAILSCISCRYRQYVWFQVGCILTWLLALAFLKEKEVSIVNKQAWVALLCICIWGCNMHAWVVLLHIQGDEIKTNAICKCHPILLRTRECIHVHICNIYGKHKTLLPK